MSVTSVTLVVSVPFRGEIMNVKQMRQARLWVEISTPIKAGWLCAHYTHGQDVSTWLHQTLAHVRQQTGQCQLPVVVVSACGREDNLVVMTLGDFLRWSHRRVVLNILTAESSPPRYTDKEDEMIYVEPLTPREQEVLALVAQGFTNEQIADALVISKRTVRQHLNHIYAKLGVSSRLQAVLKANLLVYVGQSQGHADRQAAPDSL